MATAPTGAPATPAPAALSRRLHLVLHLVAGGLLLLGAGGLATISADARALSPAVGGAGVGLLLLARGYRWRRLAEGSSRVCAAAIVLVLTVAAAEGVGRWSGFDFDLTGTRILRLPPYFRIPTVPTGTVFFRRPGPDVWSGQVIAAYLRQLGLPVGPYATEPAITVRYDANGFRNEGGGPWRIAVVGDSFVELGHLPAEALFTTLLARRLDAPVLNVSTSYTGPLTHLHYVEAYALRPGVRDAVIVLYEGNDFDDLERERQRVATFERSGIRPSALPPPQTSLVRTLSTVVVERLRRPRMTTLPVDGLFASADGDEPVTLTGTAPVRARLAPELLAAWEDVLARFATLAAANGARPWIAYMPCKDRVLHGMLKPVAGSARRLDAWTPDDLPVLAGTLCRRHGVGFVDLTPDLVEATRRERRLVFDGVWDNHLNARGAAVVAATLARALGP